MPCVVRHIEAALGYSCREFFGSSPTQSFKKLGMSSNFFVSPALFQNGSGNDMMGRRFTMILVELVRSYDSDDRSVLPLSVFYFPQTDSVARSTVRVLRKGWECADRSRSYWHYQ
jgi:hypothetical protein